MIRGFKKGMRAECPRHIFYAAWLRLGNPEKPKMAGA
jgi:hypothetical protein